MSNHLALVLLLFPQFVEVLSLSIAGSCGLYLLGNYGVEGDFSNVAIFDFVTVAGGASLLVTAVWKGLVIRGEIKRDEAIVRAGSALEDRPAD